jgi:predicted nucleic acid-binding Zn ribbon protein
VAPAPGPASGRKGVDLARAALMQARAQAKARYEKRQEDARGRQGLHRSGARPDDRDPQTLQQVLVRLSAERGWHTPVAVHSVMDRWTDIVGPQIARYCVPERFEDGRLTVRVESPTYATHIRFLLPEMLKVINRELGHGTVTHSPVLAPGTGRGRGRWNDRD